MRQVFVVETCRTQVSPDCTKTFNREVKPGRPRISCDACMAYKVAKALAAKTLERECPCGDKFMVKPGKGKKADKCDKCRTAGIVYRRESDDGKLVMMTRDQATRESAVKREETAKERAMLLTERMAKLLAKTDRKVIVH